MEEMLLNLAASQGIWVVMFVSLFLYTIKNNKELERKQENRESKYLEIISELTDNMAILNQIKEDIGDIKNGLKEQITQRHEL